MLRSLTCCEMMIAQLGHECDKHSREECPDCVILMFPNGTVGIPIRDGGSSILKIEYCPWCGTKIGNPTSDA